MSSTSSNPYAPLRLEPRPSRTLRRALLALCAGALATPWLAPLPVWGTLLVDAVVVTAALTAWRRRPELGGAPLRLEWDRAGKWRWHAEGRQREVELHGETFLSPGLVILNFGSSWRRRSLVLLRDSLDPVSFRRLKVRLRIEGMKSAEKMPAADVGAQAGKA